MAIQQAVKESKGKYVANVSKDSYSIYTRNEKENRLLSQVDKLMVVVDEIEEDNKVYKMILDQAVTEILQFNMRTQEIQMKPQIFRELIMQFRVEILLALSTSALFC